MASERSLRRRAAADVPAGAEPLARWRTDALPPTPSPGWTGEGARDTGHVHGARERWLRQSGTDALSRSGLEVESEDEPVFKKEVKLSFPVPDFSKGTGDVPAKPEDAFFYVFRRVEGPAGADGKPTVLFETIDEAVLACTTEKPSWTSAEK